MLNGPGYYLSQSCVERSTAVMRDQGDPMVQAKQHDDASSFFVSAVVYLILMVSSTTDTGRHDRQMATTSR